MFLIITAAVREMAVFEKRFSAIKWDQMNRLVKTNFDAIIRQYSAAQ